MAQHAEIYEEAVQLKTLQTVLTILQSKLHPEDEEGVAFMLGICFRLLASPRCADSVHTTAAATLRQVCFSAYIYNGNRFSLPSDESVRDDRL